MMTLPKIVERSALRYVAVCRRVTIPFADEARLAYEELFAGLAEVSADNSGQVFMKYNRVAMPQLDIEFGITVAGDGPFPRHMIEGTLPEGRYASLTYTGPYDHLQTVNALLVGWAKETGLVWDARSESNGEIFSARLEIYENSPLTEPDPERLITTLAFEIRD